MAAPFSFCAPHPGYERRLAKAELEMLHAYVVMDDEGGAEFDWAALGETTDGCD